MAAVTAHRRRVTEGVGDDQYLATMAVLRRMATNLGWVDPAGDDPRA